MVEQGNEAKKELKDPFIEGNKKIVNLENEEIELFIKRYGWQPHNTGSGLRIQITENGQGEFPKKGDIVTVQYQTLLLNGKTIYNSETEGVKKIAVDKSDEITGLHEAVKLMKKGAKARLVIPSHLAYGVTGDGNKISGRAPLAFYLELTEIEKK